ncbi:hypothetical protein SynRS9907_00975 [Synechococcus sp. RS9907]|nr:hypothetical protein SynRS9907_00975 [Synechococcus sp. RS9907]
MPNPVWLLGYLAGHLAQVAQVICPSVRQRQLFLLGVTLFKRITSALCQIARTRCRCCGLS